MESFQTSEISQLKLAIDPGASFTVYCIGVLCKYSAHTVIIFRYLKKASVLGGMKVQGAQTTQFIFVFQNTIAVSRKKIVEGNDEKKMLCCCNHFNHSITPFIFRKEKHAEVETALNFMAFYFLPMSSGGVVDINR